MTDERLAEIRAHIEAPCREIWLSQALEVRRDAAELLRELETLRAFRAAVLHAMADGDLSCNCRSLIHEDGCPLGQLEIEAEEIWRERVSREESKPQE